MKRSVFIIPLALMTIYSGAQQLDTITFNYLGEHLYSGTFSAYSSQFDQNGADVLYVASLQLGLVTFDVSDPTMPTPIDTIPPSVLGQLSVSNVFQAGSFLYLAIGDFQNDNNNGGLAVVDVSTPTAPTLISSWDSLAFHNGSAIVEVIGDRAYLGAMTRGLVILDVSDPQQISYVNHFLPDSTWPGISNFAPAVRGLDVRNDTAFIAFDAGAFRIVDLTDEMNPVEIAMYVNPNHPNFTPNASNHVKLVGSRAYVSYDACGMEVLDISDPLNIQQVDWINPWNCMGLSWFGSDGHGNEMLTVMNDSLLFLGAGDSEVMVFDITGPPVLQGGIIMPDDSVVAWGIAERDGLLALSIINNDGLPFQPFLSTIGGIRLYDWEVDFVTGISALPETSGGVLVYPNPTWGDITLRIDLHKDVIMIADVLDLGGRTVMQVSERNLTSGSNTIFISMGVLPAGVYQLRLDLNGKMINTSINKY